MLPNFLIVGAAKSGTTSLYRYLSQHPDIFMPAWKELSYFTSDPSGPLHRVKSYRYYEKLFSKADGHKAVGEASTAYLYDEGSPLLIRSGLGQIKILIILRDPVAMSYSLYNHQVRKEGETKKTFEEGLAAESERFRNPKFKRSCYGWHANYYYFRRGLYSQQVKRYLDVFGSEKVKILIFEQFINNIIREIQEMFKFLNVDSSFVPEIKVHNPAGGIVSFPKFWTDIGLLLKTQQYLLSKNPAKKIPHLLRNIRPKPLLPIHPSTESKLRKRFLPDILSLEQLLDLDLTIWKR